jgi:hypothetical protein
MRAIRGVLLVVGFLLLLACQREQRPDLVDLGDDTVIFSAEQAEAMEVKLWIEGSVPIEGFWTPEPTQVLALERALPAFLAEHPELFRRDPPPSESLAAYRGQYIGIVEEGQRLIYGNYFCDAGSHDWQQEMILVDDGGDCFFQVRYDPATGAFREIRVNGEA